MENYGKLIDHFIDNYRQESLRIKNYVSNDTLTSYRFRLNLFGRWLGGDDFRSIPINKITSEDIEKYLQWRRTNNIAPASINTELSTLRSFWKTLKKTKGIPNIAKEVDDWDKSVRTESKHLKEGHISMFVDHVNRADRSNYMEARNTMFLEMLLKTGCRISECLNLKGPDIELEEEEITIRFFGKGGKWRLVPLPLIESNQQFKIHLKNYLDMCPDKLGYIFLSNRGKRWSGRQARRFFKNVLKEMGLTEFDYKPHSVRHSVATKLLFEGVPDQEVARILGHSSSIVTRQIYSHTEDSKLRDAMKKGY